MLPSIVKGIAYVVEDVEMVTLSLSTSVLIKGGRELRRRPGDRNRSRV